MAGMSGDFGIQVVKRNYTTVLISSKEQLYLQNLTTVIINSDMQIALLLSV